MGTNRQMQPPYIVSAENCQQCSSAMAHHELSLIADLASPDSIDTCSACQGAGIQYVARRNGNYLIVGIAHRFVIVGKDNHSRRRIDGGELHFEPPILLKDAYDQIKTIECDEMLNKGECLEVQIVFRGVDGSTHPYEVISFKPLRHTASNVVSLGRASTIKHKKRYSGYSKRRSSLD